MLPFKTILSLDREAKTPLYIQISNEMIKRITTGVIPVGFKLPGGRKMGEILGISRRTVAQAYEELEAQGWIEIKASQGTFISSKIPVVETTALKEWNNTSNSGSTAHFELYCNHDFLERVLPPDPSKIKYTIDTGYPDVRLLPSKDLSQSFYRVLMSKSQHKIMNYAFDFKGNGLLREEISNYLSQTRGIKLTKNNIIITRGSLMAFNLIFQVLLNENDKVIVGDISFKVAKRIIKIAGGIPVPVAVDENGMDVDAIEELCKKEKIRAVFVMPHHHHPTTVPLCAPRRMKLLNLAYQYKFAIIEDDYDYDFHYASSPILPMASADEKGVVLYVGSLSKTVAPSLRMGFIVAPENFINELTRYGRFIDCHGNSGLEKAIAYLFKEGVIQRHLKKSLKTYRVRRDLFCKLLEEKLGKWIQFRIPEGGLAAWVTFDKKFPIHSLREKAAKKGLLISRTVFQDGKGNDLNAIRMGFASLNEEEMKAAIDILAEVMKK